jgi:GST-like protein
MTCETFSGERHDRLLHLDHGQRLQAAHDAGGNRAAAQNHSGRSAQEGADGPGHKIPAIVDHDGPGGAEVTVCESGAILKYLGEKSGKFYPSDAPARAKVDQWLFYGSATFTTLAQQFGHWTIRSPIKAPPAQEHYEANLRDMLGILDRHLGSHEYFGGAYSIADMTMYSDVHIHGVRDIGLNDYANVKRWHDAIEARPAVQRAWVPFAS